MNSFNRFNKYLLSVYYTLGIILGTLSIKLFILDGCDHDHSGNMSTAWWESIRNDSLGKLLIRDLKDEKEFDGSREGHFRQKELSMPSHSNIKEQILFEEFK